MEFIFQIINNCCVANLFTSEMGQELLVAERLMHTTVATTAAIFQLFVSMETVVWFPKYCTFVKTGSTVLCFQKLPIHFTFLMCMGVVQKQ